MNVLITSAGRRTSLLRAFQKQTAARGGGTFAGDMDPLAPALYLADRGFVLPAVEDPSYLETLLAIVQDHAVLLLVPTIDPELPLLAEHAEAFRGIGCTPLISSAELVRIAADKATTLSRFSELGIRTPRSWLPEELAEETLPERLFIKPRDGSASRDAFPVQRDDLLARLRYVPNPMIQEYVDGREITIDALIDLHGIPIHSVPRLRIRTLAGESIQGVTLPDAAIREWTVKLLHAVADLGGRGAMTVQAFLTPEGPLLSEINPRFGGGFPLAHEAGAHYPEWILQMLEGRAIAPRFGEYETGLHMTRYYVEELVRRPMTTGDDVDEES